MILEIILQHLPELIGIVISIVAAIVVYLISKYLKVTVDKAQIEAIIQYLVSLIVDIETHYAGKLTGEEKKRLVITRANEELEEEQKSFIRRVIPGGIGTAVEWAFQTIVQPNLIRKVGKILK